MNANKEILVYADESGQPGPLLMGKLFASFSRGREVFFFEYEKAWLKTPFAQEFDPDLKLFTGPQYPSDGKSNFGIFLDSSPDRWGRVLMDRRETLLARTEQRKPRGLNEVDYLLGVFDAQRMGALRFKETPDGPFVNDNPLMATPPWSSIRQLEQATQDMENELVNEDDEMLKWLHLLLAPGSSLGGARPKAGVRHTDGSLWIAKFPSRDDRYDVGAWEMITNELAQKAGIQVVQAMTKRLSGTHHTFLTKRFDRTNTGRRLHFASAMSLLGYTDGANHQEGASYLELAEFLMRKGAKTNQDMEELFRRIVFSICVSNTDDHLRNHGFLLTPYGWRLSPAYDINPNPRAIGLKLNISERDNALDLDLAKEVAPYFRVKNERASAIIQDTITAVSQWRQVAAKYKLSRDEQDRMAAAFRFS
jgi:serine/threonine-protein kinase HipA